jgi:hypothetical protein
VRGALVLVEEVMSEPRDGARKEIVRQHFGGERTASSMPMPTVWMRVN